MYNHVWEKFYMEVKEKSFRFPFTQEQIHISAAQWPNIQDCSGSPGVQHMCATFSSFCSSSIKKHRSTLSDLIRGQSSIHRWADVQRVVLGILRPSAARPECRGVAVRPLHHRADNTAQYGSALWPVTPGSWGQSRVNRGQSLRTPHGVPLSSGGRVAR